MWRLRGGCVEVVWRFGGGCSAIAALCRPRRPGVGVSFSVKRGGLALFPGIIKDPPGERESAMCVVCLVLYTYIILNQPPRFTVFSSPTPGLRGLWPENGKKATSTRPPHNLHQPPRTSTGLRFYHRTCTIVPIENRGAVRTALLCAEHCYPNRGAVRRGSL